MIKLSFHGAAGTVTGSKYLLEVNERRILVDCGTFQGMKELRQRNWNPLPFDPTGVQAAVLTHGHIDHVGYLPRLVKEGFHGIIYATPPTVDIASLSLADTAALQMEDAEFRNKKKLTSHEVALPLFDTADVERTVKLFKRAEFGGWTSIGKEFRFRPHIVGHLLGASSVEVIADDGQKQRSIYFSGDVGRYGNPLTVDPNSPVESDYLVCESTYGGRLHNPEDAHSALADIVSEVIKNRSVLLIPAFAVGRTQQIIYIVNHLIARKFISPINIHIDSPMAISASEIYAKYPSYHSIDPRMLGGTNSILNGKNVTIHRSKKSSQELNELQGPAIIVSSSGMMTGGRIMHHLMLRLPDPTATVAIVGFVAEGTIGRKLLDGADMVYIHKQPIEVKAKIVQLSGLSGHADYYELLHWLEPWKMTPRQVFVTHGEPSQSEAMAQHLREEKGWESIRPVLDQTVEL